MLSLFRRMAGAGAAPFGIDCGSRLLKAVQLRAEGDGYALVAAASAAVPAGAWDDAAGLAAYFRRDVRRLLASNGFRGRQVMLALPAHHLYATSLREAGELHAPHAGAQPAPDWLPFDPSEALVRRIDAGEVYDADGRRREIVTLAVRRNVVGAYLAAAAAAGLEVEGVAAEPEALLAALALSGADSRLMRLVVDLGLGCTRVYAGIGRRLMFARRLRTGGRDLEAAVTAAVGVGPEEACALRTRLPLLGDDTFADDVLRKVDQACQETVFRLVTEIRMCLEYVGAVFTRTPVHHIAFVGGGARYRRLCQRVASGLGLPARVADPMGRLAQAKPSDACRGPAWATAVGLAVQGAQAAAGSVAAPAQVEDAALSRVTFAV